MKTLYWREPRPKLGLIWIQQSWAVSQMTRTPRLLYRKSVFINEEQHATQLPNVLVRFRGTLLPKTLHIIKLIILLNFNRKIHQFI
jgi:hypothetical protein